MEINFLDVLVVGAGPIGWLLWAISILTLGLIIQYFISVRRQNILPDLTREQIQGLFENKQYREAIDLTADQPDFLSYVINASLCEAPHGYPAMERAMEEAAEERTVKLLRRIEWLNLIGNVSPMLGLLGTVWGMIIAFSKIAGSKEPPNPSELAGGIYTALVTTLLGLAIAIPSLAVYAVMRNRIDSLTSEAMVNAQELITTFRPGRKQG